MEKLEYSFIPMEKSKIIFLHISWSNLVLLLFLNWLTTVYDDKIVFSNWNIFFYIFLKINIFIFMTRFFLVDESTV